MIRFSFAYCPSCTQKLLFDSKDNYYFCLCMGWQKLKYSDRQEEITAAESYDKRFRRGGLFNEAK